MKRATDLSYCTGRGRKSTTGGYSEADQQHVSSFPADFGLYAPWRDMPTAQTIQPSRVGRTTVTTFGKEIFRSFHRSPAFQQQSSATKSWGRRRSACGACKKTEAIQAVLKEGQNRGCFRWEFRPSYLSAVNIYQRYDISSLSSNFFSLITMSQCRQ